MSGFRPDTKATMEDTFFFFFLGSLVQLRCGEGGTLQTNNTGMCSQCLSHTGPAPTHGACSLPAHTTQVLGCSARNPWPALGCLHLPGLSRSGSGTRVGLRGQTRLGLRFVPFPGLSSSGDEVFGKPGCCDLSPALSLPLGFLGVQPVHLLRRMLAVQTPRSLS